MRLLFLSGTTVGGSGRSQRELAARLRDRGHEVLFLVDLEQPARLRRFTYEQLADLTVRREGRVGGGIIRWLSTQPGRRPRATQLGGLAHLTTPVPENAAPGVVSSFRPDVVIGSSVLRLTWRKVIALCRARAVPTVIYIREVEALNHFDDGLMPADAVVANAESLAQRIEALGIACAVLPSVVEVGVTRTETSRKVALAINPIESRGVATIWELARRMPEIPFAVQESWPLSAAQLASVRREIASLPNVEFRRAEPPGPHLYQDARVLLVPYEVDNRPRVIAEAQANGIPVVCANSPALVEAASRGGIVVRSGDIEGWCTAIESLWSDPLRYDELARAAVQHSERGEMSPTVVTDRFERFLRTVVSVG